MANETENLSINIGSDPSGVEKGTQKASASIRGTTKEAKELDSAFRRIKSAVDPTFAATERYNKSLADNKRLLAAGKIDRDEYLANARALKSALDAQVASINRNSAAGRAAAAEARRQAAQQKQDAQAAAEAERQAARAVAQEKIAAARAAAAAVEAAQRREQAAIKLSAQTARQAALEARRLAQTAASPSVRGVAPGSIATDRSAGQLAYARQRAEEAAARASQRAWDLAARAAEASSQRAAASLQAQAQRARQQAEEYSTRAVQLARTQASEEGRLAQQAANEIRAAKEAERAATRQAAAEAKAAAAEKRNAERMAAAAAREAAEATRQQARAEREASTAAQQLRASIDPVFAAQQRYNEVMQRATQLLMQNKLQAGEWIRIQQQAKAQMDVNVRSMGRMNSMYVQLGYQAQDVTASLASGINPLVILAQQGGQTAAALATMGGTVGRVASFMAGPWGAAIIGFTTLIGMMMQRSKEATESTLDLLDAERLRKASVEELTEALKDFNQQQQQANINTREALELDRMRAQGGAASAQLTLAGARKELKEAEEELARARVATDQAGMGSRGEAARGAYARAEGRLTAAKLALKKAEEAYALSREIEQAVEMRTLKSQAEALVDPHEAIRVAYQDEETRLKRIFTAETRLLNPVADRVKYAQAEQRYSEGIQAALKNRESSEQRLTEQAKKTNNAYGEGVSIFKSRAQAIQSARKELISSGFRTSENIFDGLNPGSHSSPHTNAMDVNIGVGISESSDPGMKSRMDSVARSYQSRGYRVLWNGNVYEPGGDGPGAPITRRGKGDWRHTQHLHLEAPSSIVGKPSGGESTRQVLQEERQAREQALQSYVESIEYQQQVAEEDYKLQLELQDQKISALKSFYGDQSAQVIRANRERLALERRSQQQLVRLQQQEIGQQREMAERAEELRDKLENIRQGQQGDNQEFNAQSGLISEKEALIQRAAMLDEEYVYNVDHEQRLYQLRANAIRDQLALANLPVERRKELLRDLALLEADHLDQLKVMRAEYTREVNRTANEAAAQQVAEWRSLAATLTQSLSSAFQGMWTHSSSFKSAMIQMADQLVFKFRDMGLKMVEDWIVSLFTRKAATQSVMAAEVGATKTAEAIKSSSAIAGAATSTSATAAAGTANITTSAAEAAAGAYKSTVVIPFIGPIAAPAAAALALAAVLGFGALISARGGQGRVPYDGQMTELHKDEMVLPAHIANPLRDSLSRISPHRDKSSLSPLVRYSSPAAATSPVDSSPPSARPISISISAIDTQSGVDFIMKHKRDVGRAVDEAIRKGLRSSSR